ncbi:heat-shock protein [Enterococcus florum]|uniref:Heat-shock protein n=1 Tax=Enterococcus florum TaxID=2480627 RepID=A0A4P5PBM0_9ENTE|nr:Hsp20/alpha crystallin family protein [Enterococcus florum]GCF95126.1 heat-shock protein [Enterococcus florum]
MANLIPRNNDLMSMGGDFFDSFFSNFMGSDRFNVDIKETDKTYEVKADLPGFSKEDLTVDYQDGVLTIDAKRNNVVEDKDEEGNFLRRERSSKSFRRQFMLKNIDENTIQASFRDGVLSLELTKMRPTDNDRKRIEIN